MKNKRINNKFKRLMEFSVVTVAIVFLLIIAFFINSRNLAESRNVERISGVNKLREVLQLYYLDKGFYPIQSEWCSLELNCDNLSVEIKSYLDKLPRDPLYPEEEDGKKYSYQYRTTIDGLEYKIFAKLEGQKPYQLNSKGGFSIPSPE